jgi:predicted secreted Zn-dependent protease
MNNSNPYVPNWANTDVTFNWDGDFLITGSAPTFHLRVGSPTVTMVGPSVDMPQWRPSDPAMRRAWQSMYRTLRAHERRHEGIARTWRGILLRRLRALDLEVTASSREEVNDQAEGLIQERWDVWLGEHQAAQDVIDPYTAPLVCPDTAE